jgi:hypothetical protein
VERNSVEVSQAVQTSPRSNPQAVIMVTLYKPTAAFVRAMRKANQTPQFMTLSPVGADLLVQELGDEARGIGISQVMPYPWNDTTPMVREYQKLLDRQGKSSYYGVEAYAMAKVLVDALRKAGKDPHPRKADHQSGRHAEPRPGRLSRQLLGQRQARLAICRPDGHRQRRPRSSLGASQQGYARRQPVPLAPSSRITPASPVRLRILSAAA